MYESQVENNNRTKFIICFANPAYSVGIHKTNYNHLTIIILVISTHPIIDHGIIYRPSVLKALKLKIDRKFILRSFDECYPWAKCYKTL